MNRCSFTHTYRRACLALLAASFVIAAAAFTGTAQAGVVNGVIKDTTQWGDCSVTVGTVWDGTNGPAVGGTDVLCNHTRSHIMVNVDLWRQVPGYAWQRVRTTGWYYVNNSRSMSLDTTSYCDGVKANWDVIGTVYVDGSQKSFDVDQLLGWYYPSYPPQC